jgi:hypothetical protein
VDEVFNKDVPEVGQFFKVMSAGVNYYDDLINRIQGGSMNNHVAKDSCANKPFFVGFASGPAFEVDANVIRADDIGVIGAKIL